MRLTVRAFVNLAHEEGLALESYLDSGNPPTWTWAIGLTDAAGIKTRAYINRPAPIEACIHASIDRVNAAYLPEINKVFAGHALNEAQLAAALSFHWNTDAIGRAHWVQDWLAGNAAQARHELTTNYLGGGQLQERRNREAALFFDGQWPADLRCPVWKVSKPGYHPIKPTDTDITPIVQSILGGA